MAHAVASDLRQFDVHKMLSLTSIRVREREAARRLLVHLFDARPSIGQLRNFAQQRSKKCTRLQR